MNPSHHHKVTLGFTIVELVVTVVVVSIFIAGFFQSYLLIEAQRINVVRQSKASDIAYVNLSKYPAKPSNLNCDTAGTILGSTKAGRTTTTFNFKAESDIERLGATSQEVVAYPQNGCNTSTSPATFNDGLIRIVSTVEYSGTRSVTHATFIR